jgi:hypothetical protein
MYAALGKNDQKIYIVPSMNMTVVRIGNSASESLLAASSYDTQLWEKIMNMLPTTNIESESVNFFIYPNPAKDILYIDTDELYGSIRIFDLLGNKVSESVFTKSINTESLLNGQYTIELVKDSGLTERVKLVINK